MNKATEKRLEELAEQKREIHRYQESHEQEFGPTDAALLDVLEYYIHEQGHVEIDLENVSGNFTNDNDDCGGSLREMLTDMMKETR